jgi:hypothetical protein
MDFVVQGLKLMSTLNIPVYITETGIADAKGDRRPLWLQTYIPEVPALPPVPAKPISCIPVAPLACCLT